MQRCSETKGTHEVKVEGEDWSQHRRASGGSGCSRGGTFALVFAYDLAFVLPLPFPDLYCDPGCLCLCPCLGLFLYLYLFVNQGQVGWSRGEGAGRVSRDGRTEGGSTERSRVPWRRSIPRLEGGKNGVRFAAWSSAAGVGSAVVLGTSGVTYVEAELTGNGGGTGAAGGSGLGGGGEEGQ